MDGIKILKEHCEFVTEYDCYVLLAVSRKKDTPEITNSQEIVFREIIRHEDDIVRKFNKISNQANNYRDENGKKFPFYLYVSLNARDSFKAFHKFQHRLMDWNLEIAQGSDQVHERIRRTDRHFISILASSECRSKNRYFMIDYDSKKLVPEFKLLMSAFNIDVLAQVETKNGFHFKVKPFNRKEFYPRIGDGFDWEVKVDAQLFVGYIGKN